MLFNVKHLDHAFEEVASLLPGREGVRVYVVGASAGLLGGMLSGGRVTGDVDVAEVVPATSRDALLNSARRVARALQLPDMWMNDDCRVFAWTFPLGWIDRCARVRQLGMLEVWVISRLDFIAAKVVAAPRRPQDLVDLNELSPTSEELDFVEQHIQRLQNECLDPDRTFAEERAIIAVLRRRT